MPILPIDLQIMFSHINQIGKEQAIQKEVSPLQQSIQGLELAKETIDKDSSVNETNDIGSGVEEINEEKKQENRQRKKKQDTNKEEKKKEKEAYKEPHLGHYIDILG